MSVAYKVSSWNRHRKWRLFLSTFQLSAQTKILDVGYSEQEYSDTDNFLEKYYPYQEQITALSIETPDIYLYARKDSQLQIPEEAIFLKKKESSERYPQLKVVTYDGKVFPFADKTFDICWSNAVLEHVGNEEEQIFFLKEIKRVAKKAFITTPNKYFPIEVHTRTPILHFLPKKIFDSYLHFVGKGWAADDYMYLLSERDLHKRLHDAGITEYKIIKNRLLSFVLDFVIILDMNTELPTPHRPLSPEGAPSSPLPVFVKSMPKVSVIIPAYNAMTYLPETMGSVLRQTFTDFEVLIVDDGSSDNISQWAAQITDLRVKLLTQSNQGLSGARNTGINHSQGEYIAFLDADDLWEPTKLEKQVRSLDENPEAGLVYTWTALIDEKGISTGRIFANNAEGYVWEKLVEHNIVECGSVAMVRRCCFETVGVFDTNLGSYVEDWDMWLRIARRYAFKVIREPLVYYRQHSTSASKNWEAMEQSFRIVIEKAFFSAPRELQYLKSRSYGCAYLCLAWKPLQSQAKDFKKAIHFRQDALNYYPQICFSKEYFRLSLAIALMRYFGVGGYSRFLALTYALRRRIRGIAL